MLKMEENPQKIGTDATYFYTIVGKSCIDKTKTSSTYTIFSYTKISHPYYFSEISSSISLFITKLTTCKTWCRLDSVQVFHIQNSLAVSNTCLWQGIHRKEISFIIIFIYMCVWLITSFSTIYVQVKYMRRNALLKIIGAYIFLFSWTWPSLWSNL